MLRCRGDCLHTVHPTGERKSVSEDDGHDAAVMPHMAQHAMLCLDKDSIKIALFTHRLPVRIEIPDGFHTSGSIDVLIRFK